MKSAATSVGAGIMLVLGGFANMPYTHGAPSTVVPPTAKPTTSVITILLAGLLTALQPFLQQKPAPRRRRRKPRKRP